MQRSTASKVKLKPRPKLLLLTYPTYSSFSTHSQTKFPSHRCNSNRLNLPPTASKPFLLSSRIPSSKRRKCNLRQYLNLPQLAALTSTQQWQRSTNLVHHTVNPPSQPNQPRTLTSAPSWPSSSNHNRPRQCKATATEMRTRATMIASGQWTTMISRTGITATAKASGSRAVTGRRNLSMVSLTCRASSGRRASVGRAMNAPFCTSSHSVLLSFPIPFYKNSFMLF